MEKTILLFLIVGLMNVMQAVTPESEKVTAESVTSEPEVEESAAEFPLSKMIQPRAEDGRWLYLSTYFEEGKKLPGGSSREEVVKSKEIDGVTCYLVKLTMDWRSILDRLSGAKLMEEDYSYYWEYVDGKGSYNYTCEDQRDVPASLEEFELTLMYPVKKGDTYKAEEADWKVIDEAAKVGVKAGEFACVVYQTIYVDEEFPEESSRERYYMAPGVGLVRWEMDYKLDEKWVLDARDDLLEYKLGEALARAAGSD